MRLVMRPSSKLLLSSLLKKLLQLFSNMIEALLSGMLDACFLLYKQQLLKLQNGSIFLFWRNFCDSVQDARQFFTLTCTCLMIKAEQVRSQQGKEEQIWIIHDIYAALFKCYQAFCRLHDQVIVFHLDLFGKNCYNPVQDIRNSFSLSIRYDTCF